MQIKQTLCKAQGDLLFLAWVYVCISITFPLITTCVLKTPSAIDFPNLSHAFSKDICGPGLGKAPIKIQKKGETYFNTVVKFFLQSINIQIDQILIVSNAKLIICVRW